ncbi:glycosyltransferase family 39 protein [Patescibacteria group bacterium]|nr:glycosyltransferase family 39 protein [Patescibacteria group bacterium]
MAYLRRLGSERIPNTTDILDEKDYAWVGYSFRRGGIPSGWSMVDGAYKAAESKEKKERKGVTSFDGISLRQDGQVPTLINKETFVYPITRTIQADFGKGKEYVTMVQPFLDHSPLAGILYSLKIPPIKSIEEIKAEDYRAMAVEIGLLSSILIGITAWTISSSVAVGVLSMVIYSTSSVFVLGSRYALIENIMIPLFLGCFIMLQLFLKTKKWWWLVLGAILAGLTITTKESGIFVLIAGVATLMARGATRKEGVVFGLITMVVGLVYYGYAWWLAPGVVKELFLDQSGRGFWGSLNFLSTLPMPRFSHFPIDGYWVWGELGIILLGIKKQYRELVIWSGSYLAVMLVMGGANYSWYYLPLVPFVVIGGGLLLKKLILAPNVQTVAGFFLLPLSTSFYWGYMVYRSNAGGLLTYRLMLVALISGGWVWWKFRKEKRWVGWVWSVAMVVIIYQLYKWNIQGLEYIIGNWEKLPANMVQ